jgi:hypothetical protein
MNTKKPWSAENAVAAFDKALTRSAHDRTFRNRLTASLESAKEAVSEDGDIEIPKDVVIVFHEGRYNEKYHVFWLPEFDQKAQTTHTYKFHFECCYNPWFRSATPTGG